MKGKFKKFIYVVIIKIIILFGVVYPFAQQQKEIIANIVGIMPSSLFGDIGEAQNIKEGMEFNLVRDGKIIGTTKVIKVNKTTSEFKIIKLDAGIKIKFQDKLVGKVGDDKKQVNIDTTTSKKINNIAIIPFNNITGDEEKNWIGAGFSATLTTKLGKVKSINLIEKEQLSKILEELKFQYSGLVDEQTAVKLGKIYGVDVLVIGEFQIAGNNLRVSARFVNVETGKIIDTAETIGNSNDVFKLQDDIAFELIYSLNITLDESEKEEIKINPTNNLTAYELLYKGYNIHIFLKDYDKAIEYYTKAIELDKNLSSAYNNRGGAYYDKGLYDKAIEDYNKAIEIDPTAGSEIGYTGAYYVNRGNAYFKKKFMIKHWKIITKHWNLTQNIILHITI